MKRPFDEKALHRCHKDSYHRKNTNFATIFFLVFLRTFSKNVFEEQFSKKVCFTKSQKNNCYGVL
jgi:hypothetical protein